jgi:SHS2 domain-containing protein
MNDCERSAYHQTRQRAWKHAFSDAFDASCRVLANLDQLDDVEDPLVRYNLDELRDALRNLIESATYVHDNADTVMADETGPR